MIFTDGLGVTQDEAVELCVHHLRLAALFFEAGGNAESFVEEVIRNSRGRQYERPWAGPALAWIKSISDEYVAMETED